MEVTAEDEASEPITAGDVAAGQARPGGSFHADHGKDEASVPDTAAGRGAPCARELAQESRIPTGYFHKIAGFSGKINNVR